MKKTFSTLLFLLIVRLGWSHSYDNGYQGSYSNSYSSSSASASSSAFSSAFSSDSQNVGHVKIPSTAAFSSAIAKADVNGATANSGAGAFSGSGAGLYSGSGSGAFAQSGSSSSSKTHANSGSYSGTFGNQGHNGKFGIPVTVINTGPNRGAINYTGQGFHANSGASVIPVVVVGCPGNCPNQKPGVHGQLNQANAGASNSNVGYKADVTFIPPNNIVANDLQIPNTDTTFPIIQKPKINFPGPDGNINDFKPVKDSNKQQNAPSSQVPSQYPPSSQVPSQYPPSYAQSGAQSEANSVKPGGCRGCSLFPGKPGSINDFKPVPNTAQHVVPQDQTQTPPLVRPPVDFNKFPGPTGSIYEGKPAEPPKIYPSGITPGTMYHPEPQSLPGSAAVTVIGKLPGPLGNILDSKPVDQNNIATPQCANGQCNQNSGFPVTKPGFDAKTPNFPDCTDGKCDEFQGKLGCHGDDCFGPSKRPSYSLAESSAKSNANHQQGSINFDLEAHRPHCVNGDCNVNGVYRPKEKAPGSIGKICSGVECLQGGDDDDDDDDVHPDLSLDVRNNIHGVPTYGHTQSTSQSTAQSNNNKFDVHVGVNPNLNDIPIEVDYPSIQSTPKTPTTGKAPEAPSSGSSHDFLLPGSQPYHRHVPKPHPPKMTTPTPEDVPNKPGSNYVPCTAESCVLPKPNKECHGSECEHTGTYYKCRGSSCPNKPTQRPFISPVDDAVNKHPPTFISPVNDENEKEYPGPNRPPPPYIAPVNDNKPGNTYYQCTEKYCPLPLLPQTGYNVPPKPNKPPPFIAPIDDSNLPSVNVGVQPNRPPPFIPPVEDSEPPLMVIGFPVEGQSELPRPGIPDFGVQYQDNSRVKPFISPVEPDVVVVPITIEGPAQQPSRRPGAYGGQYSGSTANADRNDYQGYVSGHVIVQKPDGNQIPVVNIQIPSNPRQPCTSGDCTLYKPESSGGYAGTFSGGYSPSPCTGNLCSISVHNQKPFDSNSSHKNLCGNGNCGNGVFGSRVEDGDSQAGSGSASYSGSGAFTGSTGYNTGNRGCKTCKLILPEGSTSGNSGSSFSSAYSGAFGGANAGSFASSAAGSGAGPQDTLKTLKDLLESSLKQTGSYQSGSGEGFGKSFAQSGSSSYGHGSSASAFSSAFSSSSK